MPHLDPKEVIQQPSRLNVPRRFFLFLTVLGVLCALMAACRQEPKPAEGTVIRTVEQNAPLAVLMREMIADMEEIKSTVVDKEDLKVYLERHRALLTAEATDPKVRDSSFFRMANAYLLHLEKMEQSDEAHLLENFKALQQSCIACHQQKCPGPLKKIEKLKIN
jgi:hypothetical protein